ATLGYVIPAHYIEAALNDELMTLPNCKVYRPAILRELRQQHDSAQLTITSEEGEKILQSALVFAADGTESTVRQQLNIQTDIFDYEQSAIVTRTMLKRSHQHIAYERFNSHGAIAMLPLLDNEC